MSAGACRKPRPFRLTPPGPDETDLHIQIVDVLEIELSPPVEWMHYPSGSVELSPAAAAKLYRMGLKPGWPDFMFLHQRAFGIELKRDGGRLSRTRFVRTRRGSLRQVIGQEDMFPRLLAAGMTLAVCRSCAEVLCAIDAWGIPRAHRINPPF